MRYIALAVVTTAITAPGATARADGDPLYVTASSFNGLTSRHLKPDLIDARDVPGNVAVNIESGEWTFGLEQPYLLLQGSRLDPPSSFRNLRLHGAFRETRPHQDAGLDVWVTTPTADLSAQDAGIAGELHGDQRFDGVGVGVVARAGLHDDWIQLDLFDQKYIDMSARFWTDTEPTALTFSGGLMQVYGDQQHLIPHVEGNLSVEIAPLLVTARLAYFYNDTGTFMLSFEARMRVPVEVTTPPATPR